jgi:hypothetical protein
MQVFSRMPITAPVHIAALVEGDTSPLLDLLQLRLTGACHLPDGIAGNWPVEVWEWILIGLALHPLHRDRNVLRVEQENQ